MVASATFFVCKFLQVVAFFNIPFIDSANLLGYNAVRVGAFSTFALLSYMWSVRTPTTAKN